MDVRKAQPGDAPSIEALYKQLVPGDPNVLVDPHRLAELENDWNTHLLVAVDAGSVCGTAFLSICLDAMYGFQPYGVVDNVVVLEAARGRGAGRALLEALERAARAAHCTKLMLLSSSTRSEAHAFFEHLGYDGNRKRGFVKYINRRG